jgi:hypothetical protein
LEQLDISDLRILEPPVVWKQYDQERKRFEEYTSMWDEHLVRINALEQLFLIPG